jgi:hypoxanthine-DNA glycosylase
MQAVDCGSMSRSIGFEAIAAADARLLILGTLPSQESLKQRQYYAKKANAFWWIIDEIFGVSATATYDERMAALKANSVALWDVCASADRAGSLDSAIVAQSVAPNDFASFFAAHREIRLICFNGQPAERLYRRAVLPLLAPPASTIPRRILPSTSPAHAGMRREEKLRRWREALEMVEPRAFPACVR